MQVLSGSGVVAVVRGDPALLPLEKVERDRPGVVGLEQLLLLAFKLGSPGRKVGELGGSFGHYLVVPGMNHPRDRLDRFRVDLHLDVEALD